MVTVNNTYIFNSKDTNLVTDEIIEDHYDDGRISDEVWDHFDYWSDLNGKEVTIISVQAVKSRSGCDDWAKVFITEKGFSWWFSAHVKELTSKTGAMVTSGACNCDLAAIMIRGCRCGGI